MNLRKRELHLNSACFFIVKEEICFAAPPSNRFGMLGKNFTFAPSILRYFRIKYRKNGLFPCLIRKRIIYIEVNHHKMD